MSVMVQCKDHLHWIRYQLTKGQKIEGTVNMFLLYIDTKVESTKQYQKWNLVDSCSCQRNLKLALQVLVSCHLRLLRFFDYEFPGVYLPLLLQSTVQISNRKYNVP